MDHAPELAPPDEESQLHHRRFVRVKTLSSKEYALNDLEDTDNIFRIKEMLEEREGEAVSNQVLVGQNGDPLHDVCSLSELPEGETTLLLYLHRYPSYAEFSGRIFSADRWRAWLFDVVSVVVGALFVAALSQASFKIGIFSKEVPFSFQTMAVALIGAILGSSRGAFALLLYLFMGCSGLPFFAQQGAGIETFRGPTGGYLIGFFFAAVTGYLTRHGFDRRFRTAFGCMLCGNITIYVFGVPWLAHFIGWKMAFKSGMLPFMVGDSFKLLLATVLLPLGWKIRGRWSRRSTNTSNDNTAR